MSYRDTRLEQILKRYRPSGPPAHLKERTLLARQRRRPKTWVAVAASLLLVAGGGWVACVLVAPNGSESDEFVLAQVEQAVMRAGFASQLLATADLVAGQPGGELYARTSYREIARSYPDLAAGPEAHSRLRALSERSFAQ